MTPPNPVEVLPAALTKGEARSLENRAKRHWRTATRSVCQFAADLRRLQDDRAHIVRGFDSFGDYAQRTFDGLSAAQAKQLSRQGAVLLVLEREGRIVLEGRGERLPGTTALRRLSSIQGVHGEQQMLAVYDQAVALRPGRAIAETTVTQAERALMPAVATQAPALPAGDHDDQDDEDDDYEDEPYDPGAVPGELRDVVRDLDNMMKAVGALDPQQAEEIEHALDDVSRRVDRFKKRLLVVNKSE